MDRYCSEPQLISMFEVLQNNLDVTHTDSTLYEPAPTILQAWRVSSGYLAMAHGNGYDHGEYFILYFGENAMVLTETVFPWVSEEEVAKEEVARIAAMLQATPLPTPEKMQ